MLERNTLASIRFGFGLRRGHSEPSHADDMLASVVKAARHGPRLSQDARIAVFREFREAKRAEKAGMAMDGAERALQRLVTDDMREVLFRAAFGPGLGERLVLFWADHFTVAANGPMLSAFVTDFLESAIRPNIGARFSDMLKAVARHPGMLVYLNQSESFGPNSRAGRNRERGLNENYAREMLELHTLGVGPAYTQTDVQSLAKLLTGLSIDRRGFRFRQPMSEPGPHAVLGKSYAGGLASIDDFLEDLALHPATAEHLARKLVTHFLGDHAEPDLVMRIANAYLQDNGNLLSAYAALLSDDKAWSGQLANVKQPFDFIVSALRAGGVEPQEVRNLSERQIRTGLMRPMVSMGQAPFQPFGPDGWDPSPESWITPPLLAARMRWAADFADRISEQIDPRAFVQDALRDAASPLLKFAVSGAESRTEGIALTLISPEFNRR